MRKMILVLVACLSCSLLVAQPQFTGLADPSTDIRAAVWNPRVGQGSEYDITTDNHTKTHVSFFITGTEDTRGQTGYWLETGMIFESLGQVYSQTLMNVEAGQLHKSKWIVQLANRPPMQMPEGGLPGGRRASEAQTDSDFRSRGVRVGAESITVPAGTFQCEHWRAKDGSGDVWLSSNVVPYSVVKGLDNEGGSMILTRTVNNAKSHISGKPVPFDPSLLLTLGRGR